MITIRPAVESDIPDIVNMGVNFYVDSVYSTFIDANVPHMAETARQMIGNSDAVILVASRVSSAEYAPDGHRIDEQLVGMIGLVMFVHPISGARAASELFWWVEPDFRGTTGVKLLHHAEKWARDHQADILYMVAPTPEVERLYSRTGFTRVEVGYQKRVAAERQHEPVIVGAEVVDTLVKGN